MRCRAAARGVVLALVASLLVLPLDAPARVLGPTGAAHVAKRKKAKCRGKKVPVKVLGKTRCKSLRSAFPKPRAGDLRLIFVKAALGTDIRIKDRRGRRPAPLPADAKKGIAATLKAVPDVLAHYDRLASAPAAFAAASAPCEKPPDKKDDFKSGDIEASVNLADGSATLAGTFNGYTVRTKMGLGSCDDGFKAPDCPTADGTLKGTDKNTFSVSIEVLKGTELLDSTTYTTKGTTKLTGHVADDAKLETLEIEDTVKYHVGKGGSSIERRPGEHRREHQAHHHGEDADGRLRPREQLGGRRGDGRRLPRRHGAGRVPAAQQHRLGLRQELPGDRQEGDRQLQAPARAGVADAEHVRHARVRPGELQKAAQAKRQRQVHRQGEGQGGRGDGEGGQVEAHGPDQRHVHLRGEGRLRRP